MKWLAELLLAGAFLMLCCSSIFAQEQFATQNDKPDFKDSRLLIVKIFSDGKLAINKEEQAGTTCLGGRLLEIFNLRLRNGVFTDEMRDREDVPEVQRVAKAVWILPASDVSIERVAAVVEFVKLAGASPVKILTDSTYQYLLSQPTSSSDFQTTSAIIDAKAGTGKLKQNVVSKAKVSKIRKRKQKNLSKR